MTLIFLRVNKLESIILSESNLESIYFLHSVLRETKTMQKVVGRAIDPTDEYCKWCQYVQGTTSWNTGFSNNVSFVTVMVTSRRIHFIDYSRDRPCDKAPP